MAYYDRNYGKFVLDKTKIVHLKNGGCAKVFKYEDMIFKEYFEGTRYDLRLNPQMFDILKDIDNKHFIKLFELYSEMDFETLLKYKQGKDVFISDAYTAKYYEEASINILFESIDYILDNFRELEKLFELFTENSICASDIKRANSIITKDNIIIVDPDIFYISEQEKTKLAIANKYKLLNLLRSICRKSSYCLAEYEKIIYKINNELKGIEITENTDLTYELVKKFKHSKKVIDYFIK